MRLKGKVAIVTGAARGLGKSVTLALAREGADVALADLAAEMTNVVGEIESLGRRGVALKCDVSKWDDVQNVVTKTNEVFGRIDILVNNAGVSHVALIEEISQEDFDRLMNINAKGAFLFCKAVIPHMKQQRYGKIVNVASAAGLVGIGALTSYSMSKFAVVGLVQALAKEVGEYNINVNAICPGIVFTDMWVYTAQQPGVKYFFPGKKKPDLTPEKIVDEIAKQTMALGRPQTVEDIANAVVFLCSEEAKNITGQSLSVDGGYIYH